MVDTPSLVEVPLPPVYEDEAHSSHEGVEQGERRTWVMAIAAIP